MTRCAKDKFFVHLRKPEKEDVDYVLDWMNDPDFMLYLYGDPLRSRSELRKTLLGQIGATSATPYSTSLHLIIEDRDRKPIGMVALASISGDEMWH